MSDLAPERQDEEVPEPYEGPVKGFEYLNPNLRPEDQDVEMEAVILTPGAYASPNPETAGQTMVPLTTDVVEELGIAPEYAQTEIAAQEESSEESAGEVPTDGEEGADYNGMTVADLKAELDTRGIAYTGNASKADLVGLLEEDDATK